MPYPLKESFFKITKVYLKKIELISGLVATVVTEMAKLHE